MQIQSWKARDWFQFLFFQRFHQTAHCQELYKMQYPEMARLLSQLLESNSIR